MLVLERKEDESLSIRTPNGDTLEIHLLTTKDGRSKIGISAPMDYEIIRNELIDEQ